MKSNEKLKECFVKKFKKQPEYYIDTGGRFEILGNHTDHNHGLCLVANCSLRIKAYVAKTNKVIVKSEGRPCFVFDPNNLKFNKSEEKTSKALCKGTLVKLKELGYKIGGFTAYITSEIPNGGGVSSSAAIESLFGYIISYLYNDGKIDPLIIAKVGQFTENTYFCKPCGLLDQIGTSFSNCNSIDFKDIDNPKIANLDFNLPLTLFLIKSEGDHANLTPLYAAIPSSMKEVAGLLDGKTYLRDVTNKNPLKDIDSLNVDDEKKRKAKHFFIECDNVKAAKKAIENNDLEGFLNAVRSSQETSKNNIENTYVKGEYAGSPQEIIDNASEFLGSNGAIRIHGGGFKGTVLAFVKNDFANQFEKYCRKNYRGRYYRVHISKNAVNFEVL